MLGTPHNLDTWVLTPTSSWGWGGGCLGVFHTLGRDPSNWAPGHAFV